MLSENDLISDRALEHDQEDLFDHETLSKTVVDVIRSISPPANIALYGPWGVGKTGLSNLIQNKLKEVDEGFKYVRFDAFKYSENPLRKHILSVMADSLLCGSNARKFKESLYETESEDKFTVPSIDILKMALFIVVLMLTTTIIFSMVAALFPLKHAQAIDLSYWQKVSEYFPKMLLPSTILSALFSIWGKTFTTNRTRSAPSQEEEFEQKFKDLVKCAAPLPTDKIVIFVDELDRCSGEDVVNALDTIRTFMDSSKCMFIVAVDRQVLSASLKGKQIAAGPIDTSNPQYGSVGEYLNKVFQYQISMPPLKPQRLTAFAHDLIKNKGGVWSDNVINSHDIVSILIPPYINNPRRVKSLLNSFVISYRIVEKKSKNGNIQPINQDSIRSLAKIVFLRKEYPKFFEHLCLEHRLGEILAKAHKSSEEEYQIPLDLKEGVRELVRKYLKYEIEHHEYLSNQAYSKSASIEHGELREISGKQLLRYLSMTNDIHVDRELIYLENIGHTNGLEPEFATELEALAISNLTNKLAEYLGKLSETDKRSALLLLLDHSPLHDIELNTQGQNVAVTIFELAYYGVIDGSDEVKHIVDRTQGYISRIDSNGVYALIGAIRLCKDSENQLNRVMQEVVKTNLISNNPDLAIEVLKIVDKTDSAFDKVFSKAFVFLLLDGMNNEAFITLSNVTESRSLKILKLSLPLIKSRYFESLVEKAEDEADEIDDTESSNRSDEIISQLKLCFSGFLEKNRLDLAETIAWVLGNDPGIEWLRLLHHSMRNGWKPQSRELLLNILEHFSLFKPDEAPVRKIWLDAINPSLINPEKDIRLISNLEKQLVKDFEDYKEKEDFVEKYLPLALDSLQALKKECGIKVASDDTTELVIETFETNFPATFNNQANLKLVKDYIKFIDLFSDYSLIVDQVKAKDIILIKLFTILKELPVQAPEPIRSTFKDYALPQIRSVAWNASAKTLNNTIVSQDNLNALLSDIEMAYLNFLLVASYNMKMPSTKLEPNNDLDDLIALIKGNSTNRILDNIVALWIRHFCSGPEAFCKILMQFRKRNFLSDSLKSSINDYTFALDQKELEYVSDTFISLIHSPSSLSFMRLLGLNRLQDSVIEKLIVRAASRSNNNIQRKFVLSIWKIAKITDQVIIDSLVDKVYLRFFRENKGSASQALSHFELISDCSPASQVKVTKLLNSKLDDGVKKRLAKLLKENNFKSSK